MKIGTLFWSQNAQKIIMSISWAWKVVFLCDLWYPSLDHINVSCSKICYFEVYWLKKLFTLKVQVKNAIKEVCRSNYINFLWIASRIRYYCFILYDDPLYRPEYSDKATPNNKDGRDSRTIFIGNVPVKYDKKALSKLLKEKGNLVRYWTRGYIPLSDKISKKTAAIANLLPEEHPPLVVYALFETAADAKNALTLNGAIFEDHRLRVTHSDTKLCPPELGVFVGNLPSSTCLIVESVLCTS